MTTDTTMTDVDTGTTKQISRDDVERVCDDYPWVNYADRRKALNMLRSLMNELEEERGNNRGLMLDTASMTKLIENLEAQLAAANERADEIEMRTMVFSNHLEIAGYTKFATDLRKAIAGGD